MSTAESLPCRRARIPKPENSGIKNFSIVARKFVLFRDLCYSVIHMQSISRKGTKDLTVGNPYKVILQFALPVFLSQLFQQLYSAADAFVVGRFLGTESLGGVTASGSLIFLLTSFFDGTAVGAGIIISRYFGAKDEKNVSRAIHTNIAFGLVSGVLLTVLGVTLTPIFLRWMNTDEMLLPKAVEYLRYYFMGNIAMIMYNICRSIMNAIGDSKRPLFYLIFSSLINIGLDLLFIGVFRFGVWSAAVATVISQTMSVILCFAYLLKKGKIFSVNIRKIRFHKDMLIEIIRFGLPTGIQNSVIGFANVIVQSQINVFNGFATTAYGINGKIEGFGFLPITSFSMALTTFVGQNLGAKQYERVKKGARFGILGGIIAAELIGVIVFFSAPYLVRIFDDNPSVSEFAVKHMHITSLFYFLLSFSHCVAAICRGAGKSFVPMIVMLCVWCVLRVIYIAVVTALHADIAFIYMAYPITWTISSLIYLIYYLKSDWIHGFDKKSAFLRLKSNAAPESVAPESDEVSRNE